MCADGLTKASIDREELHNVMRGLLVLKYASKVWPQSCGLQGRKEVPTTGASSSTDEGPSVSTQAWSGEDGQHGSNKARSGDVGKATRVLALIVAGCSTVSETAIHKYNATVTYWRPEWIVAVPTLHPWFSWYVHANMNVLLRAFSWIYLFLGPKLGYMNRWTRLPYPHFNWWRMCEALEITYPFERIGSCFRNV